MLLKKCWIFPLRHEVEVFDNGIPGLPVDSSVSVTPTSSYHHISVFLQNDIRIVIKVKHWDCIKFCRSTAWFRDILWIHKMNLFKESRIWLGWQFHLFRICLAHLYLSSSEALGKVTVSYTRECRWGLSVYYLITISPLYFLRMDGL